MEVLITDIGDIPAFGRNARIGGEPSGLSNLRERVVRRSGEIVVVNVSIQREQQCVARRGEGLLQYSGQCSRSLPLPSIQLFIRQFSMGGLQYRRIHQQSRLSIVDAVFPQIEPVL